jgi:hypothetical protein
MKNVLLFYIASFIFNRLADSYKHCIHIWVTIFWIVMLCSDMVGYHHFGGPCFLNLQGEVNGTGKGGIGIGRKYKGGLFLHVAVQSST